MTKNIKNLNDVDNKVIKKAHNFEKYKNVVFTPGVKSVTNPLSCALSMFKCMTCYLFLGSVIA